jgi:hypothetical protein
MSASLVSQPLVAGRVVGQSRTSARRSSGATTRHAATQSGFSLQHKLSQASHVAAAASAVSAGVVAASYPDASDAMQRQPHHRHRGGSVVVFASDAAAAPAPTDGGEGSSSGEGKKMTTFVAGLLWFFAHQLIGVGNDGRAARTPGRQIGYVDHHTGCHQRVFVRYSLLGVSLPLPGVRLVRGPTIPAVKSFGVLTDVHPKP